MEKSNEVKKGFSKTTIIISVVAFILGVTLLFIQPSFLENNIILILFICFFTSIVTILIGIYKNQENKVVKRISWIPSFIIIIFTVPLILFIIYLAIFQPSCW